MTLALTGVEMQSPDPEDLAAHWGRIIGVAVSGSGDGVPELKLPNCSFRFVKGDTEIMSGLDFRVGDVAAVCEAAKARGYTVSGNEFLLSGVTFSSCRVIPGPTSLQRHCEAATATKQSRPALRFDWIASLALAMTSANPGQEKSK